MSARPSLFNLPTIRVGMPLVAGQLLQYGLESGLPLMFSANAFARMSARKEFAGFRLDAAAAIPEPCDAALDSSGFCAASVFGDYRFSLDQYLDLVAARSWSFWSSLDYCVEAQVAPEAATRRLRIDTTIARYWQCADRAAQRGLPPPLKVLQGHYPDEYARCAEAMGIEEGTQLVGIGSVCRRHMHGEAGVLAIVRELDKLLPRGVALHFFGLKGSGPLAALLAEFPHRVGSTDSMAYDFAVRRACPVGRTQRMRANAMIEWHARQVSELLQARAPLPTVPASARSRSVLEIATEAVGGAYGEFVLLNDLEYLDCKQLMVHDVALVQWLVGSQGASAFEDPDHDYELGVVFTAVRDALMAAGHLSSELI